jgi:hypothetical protein
MLETEGLTFLKVVRDGYDTNTRAGGDVLRKKIGKNDLVFENQAVHFIPRRLAGVAALAISWQLNSLLDQVIKLLQMKQIAAQQKRILLENMVTELIEIYLARP